MKKILGVLVAPVALAVAACGGGQSKGASQAAPATAGLASVIQRVAAEAAA